MGNSSSEPQSVSIDRESFNIAFTPAAVEELQRVISPDKSGLGPSSNIRHSSTKSDDFSEPNDVLKTNEQIKILEENYEKRLSNIEKKNNEIFEEASEEFKKSLERVEKKFLQPPKQPCCQQLLEALQNCYIDNPNKVLFCSSLAKDYSTCVNEYREAMLVKHSKSPHVM